MRAAEGRISGNAKKQGPYRETRLDAWTNAITVMEYAHHEVHGDDAFFVNKAVSLGNGDVLTTGIVTPDTTKWAHLIVHAKGTANATFSIKEGGTLSGGVAYTLQNQNRNAQADAVSGMTATTGSTGANLITMAGGTVIYSEGIASGSPIDWSRIDGEEMILKQNTEYLFSVTNGVNANIASLTLRWYEHTNRD